MSAVKDGRYVIDLGGREVKLLFSLNALDEIQDKFGGYDKLDEVFNKDNPNMIKDLKWLLTLLINEGADEGEPELTEKQVGRLIHLGNFNEVQNAIYAAFAYGASGGAKADADEEETDEGNAQSAQEN